MKRTVFYSWQSDLPVTTNQEFILKALEVAVSRIANDQAVAVEPVVDRDILGLPGTPDIAGSIFAKITASHVFVSDVSITCKSNKGRALPNPNVMVEHGYALKCRGFGRVIPIFNTAFGKVEELPFDLRGRFTVCYELLPDTTDNEDVRIELENGLESALRQALAHPSGQESELASVAVDAIENQKPNRHILLRKQLGETLERIDELQPKRAIDGGTAGDLIESINKTEEIVAGYAKICQMIAAMGDEQSAQEVFRWFSKLLSRYYIVGAKGSTNADCDYIKFLGHEMFVTLFAFLLIEEKWVIISKLLSESLHIQSTEPASSEIRSWTRVSEHLPLLIDEGSKNRRTSLHADLLKHRYVDGALATILPFQDFMAADYFLFFHSVIRHEDPNYPYGAWRAWSILYLHDSPSFILLAEQKLYADALMKAFRVEDLETLKSGIRIRAHQGGAIFSSRTWWDCPISGEHINAIGSR